MWNNVKQLTEKLKQIPPRIISYNNRVITSIREITNIANKFFIDKINKIRSKFTHNPRTDALEVL